ncbi:MAG TPA: alpha/beta fold hydrolase [Actinospica sp.]|nr:alpha/beta fold hydrolase [Actinospica sp.]
MAVSREKSTIVRADTRADLAARAARLRPLFGALERIAPPIGARLAWRLWSTPTPPSPRAVARSREGGMGEVRRVRIELPDWSGRRPTRRDGSPKPKRAAEIAVELLGPEDGPLVYLLHGWAGWRGQFAPLGRRLAASGFRVVLVEAPNHGDSGSGALGGGRSLLPDFSLVLAAVIEDFGPAHAVVGHSLGAACTATVLLDGTKAERAVFIAPPIDPVAFTKVLAAMLGFGERIRTRMIGIGRRRTGIDLASLILPPRLAGRADLPPALIVHDTDDPVVSVHGGRRLAEAWADARIVETRELGHNRILRDEDVLDLVTGFIAGDGFYSRRGSRDRVYGENGLPADHGPRRVTPQST